MIKVQELRNLAIEELGDKLSSLKKNLMQLRFQAKTGKLETKNSIKTTRRDVARIMTVINEVKRQAPAAAQKAAPAKKTKAVKAPIEKKAAVKKAAKKLPAKKAKK